MIGAARIGEAALQELCHRYGIETIKSFIEEWFDYSERKMTDAIGKLTAGTVTGHGRADPLEPLMPDGIPVTVTITVKPKEGRIDLDLRDNIDCIDAGLNESETCSNNNVMTGILNCLDPDIPRNAGSFRRIKVLLREGAIVGIPKFPHSTSVATTNLGERLVMTTQRTFAEHFGGGLAEGSCSIGPGFSVISGEDNRRGTNAPYINQVFLGSQGGPASNDYDGWVTFGNSVTNGLMFRDSVEIDEQKYPIRVAEIRIRQDSEGAGRRRGAPGAICRYGPKLQPMSAFYATDGFRNPPRGVRGGTDAAPSIPYMITADGQERSVPPIGSVFLQPGETLGQRSSGGGGYGDPRQRETELVREDVLSGFVSFKRAREVYGVAFTSEKLTADLVVDSAETACLRKDVVTGTTPSQ